MESVRERLQAARVDVDAVDADRALALLESRLFARERISKIGRYEVLARLGQGGGGVVWLAHDPELDRRVALKVLQVERAGDGSTGRRRLVREARALARFAHPNVVEIYGIEPRGDELVLVMEYLPGESVASWLDADARSVDEVLAVFVAAGEGLAAVHALGLVHRDFKPANVMLTPSGLPGKSRVKVLDFGLAGFAAARGAMPRGSVDASGETTMPGGDATLGDGDTLVGTPLFMAPEQHFGRPVDARTDQFAFCVSLWLALFGTPPFVGRDLDELARAKQGPLPRAPRRPEISRATIDVIARGLAADPARRWPSMRALLDALARSRTKRRVVPALVLVAASAAILAIALRPASKTCADADERLAGVWDDARKNGLRVDRHADSTLAALEAKLDDHAARWRDAWRESCSSNDAQLDARVACLEHARVELGALALASSRADDLSASLAAAERLAPIERCAELDADAIGPPQPDDPLLAAATLPVREAIALTRALDNAGELADALATGNDAIARARELGWPPLRAEALEVVGEVEASRGEYAAAESLLRDAFFDARESGHDVVAVNAASTLVWVVGYRLARRTEGHEWARHGEARLGSPAIGRLDEARLRNAIGTMYEDEGELDASEAAYRQALVLIEAERGVDHSDAAMVHNNLGNLAERRGDFVEAEQEQRHALAINERVHGEDHELTAMSLNNLAIALQRQGRAREGLPLLRRALAVRERVLGPEHPLVARTHMNLGVTLKALDQLDEAEQHQRRAVAIFEAKLGGGHTDLASAWINLGNVLRRQGRGEEALAAIRRARTIFEAALPADHPNVARAKKTEAEFAADLAE